MNSVRHRRQWRCLIFLLVVLTHSEVTGEPNLNASPNETNSTQSSYGIKALAGQSCSLYVLKNTWRCGHPNRGWQYELNSAFGVCIYIVREKLSWYSARDNCYNHGGVLLAPKSPFTSLTAGYSSIRQSDLEDYIYWLGYHDHDEEGCFVPHYDSSRKCADVKSTKKAWYGGGPDNDRGNQDCIAIGYREKPLFDDMTCDDEALSVCALEDVPETTHTVWFQIQEEEIIMGDNFKLSFTYRFERYVDDVQITVKNARGELFHWTESLENHYRRNYYPLHDQNSAAGEHVDAYGHYGFAASSASNKIERCTGSKKFDLHLVARKPNKKIAIRVQSDNKPDLMRTFRVVIASGYHYPTLFPPTGEIFNFGMYEFKCFARLGSDKAASSTIGVINQNYARVDRFVEDAMEGWSGQFSYSTKQLEKEEGIEPDNLDPGAGQVISEYAHWASGHYMNLTFWIGANNGRFHGRRVFCRSDTWYAHQEYGRPKSDNFTYFDIKVKFLPTKPKLTILWEGEPGKIVAGKQLRAKCEAFVGTLVDNPVFYWRTFSPVFKASTWKFNHFNGKIEHQHISVSNLPATMECSHDTVQKRNESICIQFVNKTILTLVQAYDYCKEQQHFELLRINDLEDFEYYLDQVDDYGSLIDLNDMETEGVYKTLNGTIVDPSQFSYWYEKTENDSPYVEDPDTNDCVIIRKGGLQAIPCHVPMPFICESERGYIERAEIYDPEYGPKFTSIVTIDVKDNDWLNGGKLQCGTEKPRTNAKALERMADYKLTTVSEWSDKFHYVYEPQIPTIANDSEYTMQSLIIKLNCTSMVAMEGGAITWIMREKDGVNRTWIVGAEDAIIERDPHKRISITVEEDTKQSNRSRDSGRHISTTMTINFMMPFQMSVVDCYSYNKELPWIQTSKSYGPEQLKDSHTVDYKNLGIDVTEDMLKSFSTEASTESEDEGGGSAWFYLLAFFILVGVAGIALVANKKINNTDDKDNDDEADADDQDEDKNDENDESAADQDADKDDENDENDENDESTTTYNSFG